MNRIRRIASVLAGMAAAMLGLAAGTRAALAMIPLPPGGVVGTPVTPAPHAVGMPGWQIIAIAAVAALLAAVIAVLADRAVIRHRRSTHAVAAMQAR
jgi:hypothetical protein